MSKSIYIYGFHSIESLLNTNPESILKVYIQNGRKDIRVIKINDTLSDLKIPFSGLDKNELDRIAKGEVHQGVISEVILPPLLTEDALYCGNRFIVFASHPDQNIEIRMTWDDSKKNVVFSCGHSILNRTSKTDVGKLMPKYGGGGHKQVGSCRVPVEDWERIVEEILQQMLADG